MRIQELIQLSEALNLSHLDNSLQNVCVESILGTIKDLVNDQDRYSTNIEKLNYQGQAQQFSERIKKSLSARLRVNLSRDISAFLKKNLDNPFDIKATFSNIGVGHLAQAYDYEMRINSKFLPIFGRSIVNYGLSSIDQSSDELYSVQFFDNLLSLNSKDIKGLPLISKHLPSMTESVIHEAVHLQQHSPQLQKFPGKETEYRSYLDKGKKKKSFSSETSKESRFSYLHNKQDRTQAEQGEYDRLYYGSPQEISAFSHQMALQYLRQKGHANKKKLGSMPPVDQKLLQDIVEEVISKRFPERSDPIIRKVVNRYYKLAYKEIVDYLERLLA